MPRTSNPAPYCEPMNVGLASTDRAVCARLSRLIGALDHEITSHVARGQIAEDVRAFRLALWDRLEGEGWTLAYGPAGERCRVYPPGSKAGAKVRAERDARRKAL